MSETKKFRWLSFPGLLIIMVGCAIISGDDDDPTPAITNLYVKASTLNIRAQPNGKSEIIAAAKRGTLIVPTHTSGAWYGVEMSNGTTGWVHSEFVSPEQ